MIKKLNFDDFYNTIKASIIPYYVFLFIILKPFPIQKPLQLVNDLFHQGLYGSNSFKGFLTKLSIVNVVSFKAFVFFF